MSFSHGVLSVTADGSCYLIPRQAVDIPQGKYHPDEAVVYGIDIPVKFIELHEAPLKVAVHKSL